MAYQPGWRMLACAVGLIAACGPGAGADGSGSGSGSGGSDSDTDSASSTSGPTTGAPTDSGTGGGSGSTGVSPACPPAEEVMASFSVTTDAAFFEGTDVPCTVDNVTSTDTSTTVYALCTDDGGAPPFGVTATWESTGHALALLGTGESILLTYRTDPIWWVNQWFALKIAGEQPWLIAAGVSGSSLDLPEMTLNALLDPVTITPREGVCEAQKGECGPEERLQLDLGFDGITSPVVAPGIGHAGQFVSYRLVAERATHMVGPVECSDTPGYWYDLVLESVPEG